MVGTAFTAWESLRSVVVMVVTSVHHEAFVTVPDVVYTIIANPKIVMHFRLSSVAQKFTAFFDFFLR
jgi:hypothetical protein